MKEFFCLWSMLSVLTELSADNRIYHNQFAVYIPDGAEVANTIASKHGFTNTGQIGDLENHFLFESSRLQKRSVGPCPDHEALLQSEASIVWFNQQHEKVRKKRDQNHDASTNRQSESHILGKRLSVDLSRFPDPLYRDQWFLNHGAKDGSDMNVKPAWELGYSGKNVVVTILDDGIQYNHPDLKQNYDPLASKDINDNDDDPMPQDNGDNKHGTRCAGEVAAVAFNDFCGVGVAYNASIGGVRMLDGLVNDAVEARSLSLNPSHIDIYSASWGPEDDGKTVDGPGPLAKKAFINGINKGRDGKGSIFVWASGNGGHHIDNCNCDGYTNSIFTLSISSATQGGMRPWYLEECSSTLATTYSSGTPGQDASIATVDQDAKLRSDRICTTAHTGTSASAPLAAGVCALALEANRNLTWRDMQHIVVATSNPDPLRSETGWDINAVGRSFSHKFGYGLLDAGALVQLASSWEEAPQQHICETRVETPSRVLSKNKDMMVNVSLITDGCDNMLNKVRYLEHVQCRITLKYFPRGQLKILLRSPRGTKSYLLLPRPKDRQGSSFDDWPFLSVHFWGEDPTGEWTLEVSNAGPGPANSDGLLKHWQLVLYGTEKNPFQNYSSSAAESMSAAVGGIQQGLGRLPVDQNKTNSNKENHGGESPTPFQPSLTIKGCHSECSQGCYGSGPGQCRECVSHQLGEECVAACPPDHYTSIRRQGDRQSGAFKGVCRACDKSCKKCFGPGSNHCSECQEGNYLLEDQAICAPGPGCPLGYYDHSSTRTCRVCGGKCKTCISGQKEGREDNRTGEKEVVEANHTLVCTSCSPELVLHEKVCLASCPPGYFVRLLEAGSVCEACHDNCESCTGVLDTQCGKCRNGSYYFERRCVSYCPPGYHSEESLRECVACPTGCDSCPESEGVCAQCKAGWFQTSGECLPPDSRKCQPGMYSSSGTCLACHSSCKTCTGPKDTECSSCYPDHRLHISTCVEQCPPRTRPAHQLNTCLACPHACSSCQGVNCTSCITGYYLLSDQGVCTTACPSAYFADEDSVCRRCHFSCRDCWGPGSNHCVSCRIEKDEWFAGGSCFVTGCPDSYTPSPGLTGHCSTCHTSCATCSGIHSQNCTGCHSGDLLQASGHCTGCEAGHYLHEPDAQHQIHGWGGGGGGEEWECRPCDSTCARCTGADRNQCVACSGALQYDAWSGTCVPCCTEEQGQGPCCLCGTQGVCTSPSRETRSLVGVNSIGRIFLFVAGVGVLAFSVIYVIHSLDLFRKVPRHRRKNLGVRGKEYRKIPEQGDNSPFLRDEITSESECTEDETGFHAINS